MLFRRVVQTACLALSALILNACVPSQVFAAAPDVVTVVVPTPADQSVTLTWTNPASVDFTGTMVRYSTSAFPTNTSDGTLASDVAGAVSGSSSLTVSGLTNGTTYYFSLFAHNVTPEYSAAVNARQLAMAPVFTEDFQALNLAAVSGQNGWATVGGSWTVTDTSGQKTVRTNTDNTITFDQNRIINGGNAATYSNQMLRVDWKGTTANFPGQVVLRAQSATADAGGYYLWQQSGALRLLAKTSTGTATTALSTGSFTPTAGVWYTYEISVVNNAQGLPVITAYAWQRGTAKPSTPTIQYTDTIPRFAQGVFSLGKSGASTVDYDNVTFYGMPGISNATATPGDGSVALSWTNPTYATYAGTMVRVSTSAYPTSTSDGTLVSSVVGASGGTSSVTHSGLTNGATYYFTLFPYDSSGVYGTPLYLRQAALPALFSENFSALALGALAGQNGWTSTAGVWNVVDLAGDQVVSGTDNTTGIYTNKVMNGSVETRDQVFIGQFRSDDATNYAGQVTLRQLTPGPAGYVFRRSGTTWSINYATSDSTITALATTTVAPTVQVSTWYNIEASIIDNESDLPVLTLFVWKVGTEKPATPTLQVTDSVNRYRKGRFSMGKYNYPDTNYFDDISFFGTVPSITITSPAADVEGAANTASLAIADVNGTFYIPYIQTSQTLNVTATATSVAEGGGVEFVLDEGLATEQVVRDLSSPYATSFASLTKGEYTLDAYVLLADGVTRDSADGRQVERTDIGIGDIITVIGDSLTEGYRSTQQAGPVTSWLDASAGTVSADNRQFPQYGPGSSGYYKEGFLTDFNDQLADYYGYPVFVMNEGLGGESSTTYVANVMDASWQTRQLALAPSKWLIHLGANDAAILDGATSEEFSDGLSGIVTALADYGATPDEIFIAYPIYTTIDTNILIPGYITAIDELRASLGLAGGPDYYRTFENYYPAEYDDGVHLTPTGYVRMARLAALSFMQPTISSISSVTARQVTVNWETLTDVEPTVAGYRVNYGTNSSALTSSATFGDVVTGVVSGLDPDTTYYFSVEAFDNDPFDVSYSDDSAVVSTATQTIALLSSATTGDNDGDGYIDRIVVTFSKDLDGTSVTGGDFSLGGYSVASASETSAGVVTLVVTEGSSYDTSATPLVTLLGSVSDTFANATTSGSATPTDGAAPRVVSLTPVNDTVVLRTETIQITFTEAINIATLAYTLSPSPSGLSAAWSAGNTVVTLSHAEQFLKGTSYSLSLTGANDVSGLAFGGVLSGATNPISFRTVSGANTSSSEGGSVALPTISVLSPNGGEKLVGGSVKTITWKSSGSGLSAVTLSYSLDGGATYTNIVEHLWNSGAYNWTVPRVTSERARIRAKAGDLVLILAQDESDANFSIVTWGDTKSTESEQDNSASDPVVIVETGTGPSPLTGMVESIIQVSTGEYIRSVNFPTVYFIDAYGSRRPFMDAQTFFTYESDFSNVKTVTDATLPALLIGAPMPPKPGFALVKIVSDPRVYWLSEENAGVALHWVTSEEVARQLYGEDWNTQIIDVPPTMIRQFIQGEDISV